MNLLEHHVICFLEEKEITDDYEANMKLWYPNFKVEEPMYRVVMRTNCYGIEERKIEVWTKSKLEQVKKDGFYLA